MVGTATVAGLFAGIACSSWFGILSSSLLSPLLWLLERLTSIWFHVPTATAVLPKESSIGGWCCHGPNQIGSLRVKYFQYWGIMVLPWAQPLGRAATARQVPARQTQTSALRLAAWYEDLTAQLHSSFEGWDSRWHFLAQKLHGRCGAWPTKCTSKASSR